MILIISRADIETIKYMRKLKIVVILIIVLFIRLFDQFIQSEYMCP